MIVLIGRFLFSLIFVMSGVGHLTSREMVAYAASHGVPFPEWTVPATGVMILVGGLMVMAGFKGKVGAWGLTAFLLPTAFIMHRFWGLEDPGMEAQQMVHFLKNLSMAGGALLVAHFGTGPYSWDQFPTGLSAVGSVRLVSKAVKAAQKEQEKVLTS